MLGRVRLRKLLDHGHRKELAIFTDRAARRHYRDYVRDELPGCGVIARAGSDLSKSLITSRAQRQS